MYIEYSKMSEQFVWYTQIRLSLHVLHLFKADTAKVQAISSSWRGMYLTLHKKFC